MKKRKRHIDPLFDGFGQGIKSIRENVKLPIKRVSQVLQIKMSRLVAIENGRLTPSKIEIMKISEFYIYGLLKMLCEKG